MSADIAIPTMVLDHLDAERAESSRGHGSDRAYASEVGACERQVGFRIADVPETNPTSRHDHINFWVGDQVQDLIQQAAERRWGDRFQREVPWVHKGQVSGRADGVVVDADGQPVEVWEIKKLHRFAWQLAIGTRGKGAQEGPRPSDVRQASLSAYVLGAPHIRIVYMVTDANKDEPRVADWRLPANRAQAKADLARLAGLRAQTLDGGLPARIFEGELLSTVGNRRWPCGWCAWNDVCARLPAGVVAREEETHGG